MCTHCVQTLMAHNCVSRTQMLQNLSADLASLCGNCGRLTGVCQCRYTSDPERFLQQRAAALGQLERMATWVKELMGLSHLAHAVASRCVSTQGVRDLSLMAGLVAEWTRNTTVWQNRTVYQKMVCATSVLELCGGPCANHARRIAYALAIGRNLGCDVGGIIASFLPPACPGHARFRPCPPIPPPVPTAMSPGSTVLLHWPPPQPHY